MSRLFSIADIHGRFDLLEALLDTLFTQHALDLSKDKLIFTGDYSDRGPDSYRVICKLMQLRTDHPDNVICLAGNHEWIGIMRYARGTPDDIDMFERNGGLQTMDSYHRAGFNAITQEHLDWMSKLPFKHEEPGFFFSHAPVPRDNRRSILNKGLAITSDELIWGVYDPDERGSSHVHPNGIIGVCGHIHAIRKGVLAPRFYDHYIFGDSGSGCSPKAPLCAINLITKEVIYAWPVKP